MIKLKVKHGGFNTEERCRDFAELVSIIVDASGYDGIPYKPNEWDWLFWTVDIANDYKVTFFEDDTDCFGVTYRYQCEANQYEEALAGWLAVRFGAEIVGE